MRARVAKRRVLLGRALTLHAVLLALTGVSNGQAPSYDETALEFCIDRQSRCNVFVVLRDEAGGLWLTADSLAKLRLQVPSARAQLHDLQAYYPLGQIPGLTVSVDESRQRATIGVPPDTFQTTRLSAPARLAAPQNAASPGAFLNYQLSAQHAADATAGALGELGIFGAPGVLTTTAVGRHSDGSSRFVRLDTTFTRDDPGNLRTLSVGDSISESPLYGIGVRFGGIRLARNFDLRPDLLTMPLLQATGVATVPSTVDVFVNNQLISRDDVPPGPFIIDRLPSVSGSGEISVVVRDALGREQVMTRSFYAGSTLLARGLSQYSIDLGALREDYGLRTSSYGEPLMRLSYRRGLSDVVTLGGMFEGLESGVYNAGAGFVTQLGRFGTVDFTVAAGGDRRSDGWLGSMGFEHRGRRATFVAQHQRSTDGFHQIGEAPDPNARLRARTFVHSGVFMGRMGSLALAYAEQTFAALPAQRTLTLTHSLRLGSAGLLSTSATRALGAQAQTSAFLTYTLPLGSRRNASVTALTDSDEAGPRSQLVGTLMQNTTPGTGSGYRASASSAGDYGLAWTGRFDTFEIQAEAARLGQAEGQSLYLSGASILLDRQVRAAREVTGSFAMVEVGGVPDVPVYLESQPIGRTDDRGRILLTELRPYEANRVSVNPQELPIDTTIRGAEVRLAPPFRSGIIARLAVERARHGAFRLMRRDGSPVPVGAWVLFNGERFRVVTDGFVYVTNFDHGMSAIAEWPNGRCRFRIEPPPAGEPFPDMGTIRCSDVPVPIEARLTSEASP